MQQLLKLLFPTAPVFPISIVGIQGNPTRHLPMTAAVSLFGSLGRPMRILEIGSWIGSSVLTWAQAIERYNGQWGGQIVCVDPWQPYGSEKNVAETEQLRAMFAAAQIDVPYNLFCHNISFVAREKITVNALRGTSRQILPFLLPRWFDLVYIDGDHSYGEVLHDCAQAKRLVAPDGIICGDDLEVPIPEVARDFVLAHIAEEWVADPNSEQHFHPGVTLAVAEAFGPVSVYDAFWLVRKIGDAFENVDLTGRPCFAPRHLAPYLPKDANVFTPKNSPAAGAPTNRPE